MKNRGEERMKRMRKWWRNGGERKCVCKTFSILLGLDNSRLLRNAFSNFSYYSSRELIASNIQTHIKKQKKEQKNKTNGNC